MNQTELAFPNITSPETTVLGEIRTYYTLSPAGLGQSAQPFSNYNTTKALKCKNLDTNYMEIVLAVFCYFWWTLKWDSFIVVL